MVNSLPLWDVWRKFVGLGLTLPVVFWFGWRLREEIQAKLGEDVRSPPHDLRRQLPTIDLSPPNDPRHINVLPATTGIVASIVVTVVYQLLSAGVIVTWTLGSYHYLGVFVDTQLLMEIAILLSFFVALEAFWTISERVATSSWYLGW